MRQRKVAVVLVAVSAVWLLLVAVGLTSCDAEHRYSRAAVRLRETFLGHQGVLEELKNLIRMEPCAYAVGPDVICACDQSYPQISGVCFWQQRGAWYLGPVSQTPLTLDTVLSKAGLSKEAYGHYLSLLSAIRGRRVQTMGAGQPWEGVEIFGYAEGLVPSSVEIDYVWFVNGLGKEDNVIAAPKDVVDGEGFIPLSDNWYVRVRKT